jgi:hypothetical protein
MESRNSKLEITGIGMAKWFSENRHTDSHFCHYLALHSAFARHSAFGGSLSFVLSRMNAQVVEDYVHKEPGGLRGGGELPDNSDGFQNYQNGGATACFAFFTLAALYDLGRKADADHILFAMLAEYDKGGFEGREKAADQTISGAGMVCQWAMKGTSPTITTHCSRYRCGKRGSHGTADFGQ